LNYLAKTITFCFFVLILSSCSDDGKSISQARPDLDAIVFFINGNDQIENLYFRHGEGICYGYWSYELYNDEQAYLQCGQSAQEEGKIPTGVNLISYRVVEVAMGTFQCVAKIEVIKYLSRKSKACGVDYEKGLQIKKELGVKKSNLLTIEGAHREQCTTCDDIDLQQAQQVQDKYFCLMTNYLGLLSLEQPDNDQILIKEELQEVMKVFLMSYKFVLAKEQIEGMEQVLKSP